MAKPNQFHPGRKCNCLDCRRQREADKTGIAGGFATLASAKDSERTMTAWRALEKGGR